MRQQFDDVLRLRVPRTMRERLQSAASEYARTPADVAREAIVLRLDQLSRRKFSAVTPDTDFPPEAA